MRQRDGAPSPARISVTLPSPQRRAGNRGDTADCCPEPGRCPAGEQSQEELLAPCPQHRTTSRERELNQGHGPLPGPLGNESHLDAEGSLLRDLTLLECGSGGSAVTQRRREWQPTPVFLPGEFHRQRSPAGYSLWGHQESDTTERLTHAQFCKRRNLWDLPGTGLSPYPLL